MKSKLLKILSIFSVFIILLCCSYSFADFSDVQKQAADINHDGKIDSKDLDLIVDQDFPPRPQDGVKNPTGENYFQTTIQQQQNTYVSGEVVKVLLVGNSYTYYADLGGQLAAFANKAGKKIVVVHAVHAYSGGQKLAKQNLAYACWDYSNGVGSLKTEGKTGKGIKKLKDIAKIDFANLNRAGSWDYVILQNCDGGGSGAMGNKMVYEQVKNTLQSSSNFIVCATRGPDGSATGRQRAALKSVLTSRVQENKFIVVDELKMDEIKTKTFKGVLDNLNAEKALVVLNDMDANVIASAKNIPTVKTTQTNELNVFDVLKYNTVVVTKDAVATIEEVYA